MDKIKVKIKPMGGNKWIVSFYNGSMGLVATSCSIPYVMAYWWLTVEKELSLDLVWDLLMD